MAKAHGFPLYRIRRTPNVVRTLLVELMRELYREGNSLFPEYGYHYQRDPENDECPEDPSTGVWINSSLVWEDQAPEFRPAIYVKMLPFAYESMLGGDLSAQVSQVPETGERRYARIVKGKAEIIHIGHTLAQADELLANSIDLLDAFSDIIRDDFCFDRFAIIAVNTPKLAKTEDNEKLDASIQLSFQFKDQWTLKPETPILRQVVFQSRLNALDALDLIQ